MSVAARVFRAAVIAFLAINAGTPLYQGGFMSALLSVGVLVLYALSSLDD